MAVYWHWNSTADQSDAPAVCQWSAEPAPTTLQSHSVGQLTGPVFGEPNPGIGVSFCFSAATQVRRSGVNVCS